MTLERMNDHMENNERTRTRTGPDLLVEARNRSLNERRSVSHEREPVAAVDGVEYINDSKATYLDAALNTIASIGPKVIWITGAMASDAAKAAVAELLQEKVASVILFGKDEGISDAEDQVGTENIYFAKELRTAVFLAHEIAVTGQVVLFSPACPSGNGYANYEERGAEFKRAVKDL